MAVLRSFSFGAIAVGILFGAGVAAERAHAAVADTVVIRSAVDSATLAPAVRVDTPAAAASSPVPLPVVNASNCRTDLGGAVATLTIASISTNCPVYAGGQAMIDAGAVTWMTDVSTNSVLATHAGGAGTLWLAGHHTSHGAAFAAVPDLADGSVITVSDTTGTASYRVVGRAYVQVRSGMVVDATGNATNAATVSALLRPDLGGDRQPRLVLQTCDGDFHRWMIYADLIAS